jgi:uncharacterized protein (TIGR04255 family)
MTPTPAHDSEAPVSNEKLPEYDKPPVIEVVCGVQFEELTSLQAVHLGSLWQKLKPEYDHAKEVPPLAPAIETFGEQQGTMTIMLAEVPPLPRTWLLTPKENGIVQVQRDRFLHNWKKVAPEDEYARYKTVIEMFRKRLATFEEFLTENDLGSVRPLQYEMTYVNHVPLGDGWNSLNEIGSVFPDFVRKQDSDRFLPSPDQVNWRTSFPLPDQQGRLHALIRHTTRTTDQKPLLYFELTARGMASEDTREAMWNWFDLAHVWIVRGFTDFTSAEVRKKVWRQTR